MRVFDVMASGGVVLAESSPELARYFQSGEHLFTYQDTEDLKRVALELIEDPERCGAVAKNGRQEVLHKHTLEHRFQEILSACFERKWLKAT